MNFLAGIFAILADKLFIRLIDWVKVLLAQRAEEKKAKAEETAYDKRVSDALANYKEAPDAKSQEEAFKNLINSARRSK